MKSMYRGAVILLLLSAGMAGHTQVTLNSLHAPQPGDVFINTLSSTDNVTIGPAGADQLWDYTQLDSVEADTLFFIEAADAPHFEEFPGATHAGIDEGEILFFETTDDAYFVLGGVLDPFQSGNPFPIRYDPPWKQIVFPATYGTSFTSISGYELRFATQEGDSIRIKSDQVSQNNIDGYGTVLTPTDSYPGLRMHTSATNWDSMWVKPENTWLLVNTLETSGESFQWLSPEAKGVVVSVEMDENGDLLSVGYLREIFPAANTPITLFTFTNLGEGQFQFSDASQNGPTSWLWDFGDGKTSSEQDPLHTYTASGDYEVCLTASNDAGSDTDCQTVSVVLSSVRYLPDGGTLTVFPNPATDQVRFRLDNDGMQAGVLTIHNEAGQKLHDRYFNQDETIPTHDWPAGVYFYQLRDRQGRLAVQGRLVITR